MFPANIAASDDAIAASHMAAIFEDYWQARKEREAAGFPPPRIPALELGEVA